MRPSRRAAALAAVTLVLAAWWAGAQERSAPAPVAMVGALPIAREDFERRAAAGRAEFERRRGERLEGDLQAILDRQILESLIRANLLVLEAKRTGVRVTDAEAEAQLKNDPFFNPGGKFDPARFQAIKTNDPAGFRQALERTRAEAAGRKLAEQLQRQHRPEEERVRRLAERAMSTATIDWLMLPRFDFGGDYQEPREAEVLARWRAAGQGRPLREAAPEIRAQLREEARTRFEERELRALYETRKDSLKAPGYRVRYAVADTGLLDVGRATAADLERFYQQHLADYTSYDAATASIAVRPLAEVRDELIVRWSRERRMLLAKSLTDGWLDTWGRGVRDRNLERQATLLRDVGPLPAGAEIDTGLAARVLSDTLARRGMALGVGVLPFPRGLVVYHVYERTPDRLPTFEQLKKPLTQRYREQRMEEYERLAKQVFDRDPQRFAVGNVLHFTRIDFEPMPVLDVPLTRAEIERFHRENIDRYSVPEQVRARHILISPEGSGPEADEKARRRAEELLARLRAGEDFATLAERHSDDPPTRTRGGDLGYFSRGAMLEPVERVAFSLKTGTVSDPVRTEVGYHLIEVLDHQPMQAEPLVTLYSSVGGDAAIEKGLRLARRLADSIYSVSRTPAQAVAIARRHGYHPTPYTHEIGSTNYPEHLRGPMARLEKLPLGKLYPGILDLKTFGAAILWPDSIAPPRMPTWAEARPRALEAFIRDASLEALEAKRAELDSLLAAGWSFDSVGAMWGGLRPATGLKPGGRVRGLGDAPAVDSLVFGGRRAPVLANGEVSDWLDLPQGLLKVRLVERQGPSPSQLAARMESERRLGLERNLYHYYDDLKKRHTVRILDPRLRDVLLPAPPPDNAGF